jgi:hypothetical protein
MTNIIFWGLTPDGIILQTSRWKYCLHLQVKKYTKKLIPQIANRLIVVRFEVFMAVTMKNVVFWDVTPCRSCELRFGGKYILHFQGIKIHERGTTCSRWFLASGFLYSEDGVDTFLRNVGSIHKIYTAPHPRRRHSSDWLLLDWLFNPEDVGNNSFKLR